MGRRIQHILLLQNDFFLFCIFFSCSSLKFFSLPCCCFVSNENMEIHIYWYSNRDLPSQTEAKNYVNANVLTAKINHKLQATWISWGKRGKDVGWGVQLATRWSQKMEHHTQKSGNIYKHNFLVSHKQKMQSDWQTSRPTTILQWRSFIIFRNYLCSL